MRALQQETCVCEVHSTTVQKSGLTSISIGLLHGLGGEQRHASSLALLQQGPHMVPGAGIQPSRWLV